MLGRLKVKLEEGVVLQSSNLGTLGGTPPIGTLNSITIYNPYIVII